MAREIEIKLRLNDAAALRQRLAALKARFGGLVLETNYFLDQEDARLRRAGCGLRVRTLTPIDRAASARVIVTYKGPFVADAAPGIKEREEIEFEVADAPGALRVFERLGYQARLVFEKRRETWNAQGCEVTIDELPGLGHWCEIEGPSAAAIAAVRAALGLEQAPVTAETYADMADREVRKRTGRTLRF